MTDMYVTGVLYNESAFPDSPNDLFSVVDAAFRTISILDYVSLNINRSETRFSNGTTREQLLIFMKDITYNGNTWLTLTDVTAFRNAIIAALNTVDSLTYDDVEVRCTAI